MAFNALVVDDNPDILDNVKERLESMGHTCDLASSQTEAKSLLANNRYAYVLLDLAIPVKSGRSSHATNGEDLLWTIRRTKGFEDIPIIIMISQDERSLRFATKVVRNGGTNNMVLKPFSEHGRALGKAVRDALRHAGRSHPGAKSHSQLARDPGPLRPFEEGEMVFCETRVELCGVNICDGVGSGLMRAILDILQAKDSRGKFVALSGEELAQQAGDAMTGQNDIADAVRRLRERIKKVMLDQANVKCGRQDVITNDRKFGYSLSHKITVDGAIGNDVDNTLDDVNNPSTRQLWILSKFRGNGEMRKGEIFQSYQKQFSRSKTTLERDLEELRQRGLMRFEGEKRSGSWRCA